MRVLHVISTLDRRAGGPTTVLIGLSKQQVDDGHEVAVCTTDRGIIQDEVIGEEVIRRDLDERVSIYCFSVQFAPLLYSKNMARWLKESIADFDIVHIHGLYRFPTTFAANCARKCGVPYVIRPHGSLDPFIYRRSSRSVVLKRAYERLFDIPNLNSASAIHYTSEEERRLAGYLHIRAPSFVVGNGIDWAKYEKLPERGGFRETLGLPASAELVLFLGRLSFKKGLELLVPAFQMVRRARPNAVLVIAGPDHEGLGQEIRRLVDRCGLSGHVYFPGAVEGEMVVQAYVDAELFVLSSRTENFGMAVVEAMACGTPVVISDQVNICDVIKKEGAGIVTRCDIEEVAKGILALLDSPELRDRIGKAGRRLVHDQYGWATVSKALISEYAKVLECSRSRDLGKSQVAN